MVAGVKSDGFQSQGASFGSSEFVPEFEMVSLHLATQIAIAKRQQKRQQRTELVVQLSELPCQPCSDGGGLKRQQIP